VLQKEDDLGVSFLTSVICGRRVGRRVEATIGSTTSLLMLIKDSVGSTASQLAVDIDCQHLSMLPELRCEGITNMHRVSSLLEVALEKRTGAISCDDLHARGRPPRDAKLIQLAFSCITHFIHLIRTL
jgi:hypothetical protein